MYVVGGLIVGSPADTRESIDANLAFARRYVDWPYIQHPTPYPGTPMTRDFRERGLIVDEDVAHYDGTTAVVRSEHVSAAEIEFLRWRAERWMKMKHLPAAFVHSPWSTSQRPTYAGARLPEPVSDLSWSRRGGVCSLRESRQSDAKIRLEPHEVQAATVNQAA
jgi:hypothetical protein